MANCKTYEKEKNRRSKDYTTPDTLPDNRFDALTDSRNDDANTDTALQKAAKHPVFVYVVTGFPEMQNMLNEFLDGEQYIIKSLANYTIILTCQTPDT